MSDGIDDMGSMSWRLVLCLLFAWVVVFLCLSKGIKSSGKVCSKSLLKVKRLNKVIKSFQKYWKSKQDYQ